MSSHTQNAAGAGAGEKPAGPRSITISSLPRPCGGAAEAVGAALPLLAAGVAFAAGADVLRQAKVRTLMVPALATENVPAPGLWGLLQGVASAAAALGLLYWSLAQPAAALWVPLALGAAGFIALFNLAALLYAYRWMD